jgi:PAS domain S-box-containing protein
VRSTGYTPAVPQGPLPETVARELSAIYDNVPGILFYVAIEPGDEFRFLSMSRAGLAAMGLRREQVEGVLVRDVIPSPSRDIVLGYYREAIRSGCTVRWTEVSEYPSGRKVGEVAVTPLRDQNGVTTHLIGIVHDITEREHLEEALRRREQRERLALDASAGGSWTWDATANHVDWDDRFRVIYGLGPDEPATFDAWLNRVHHEDRPHVLAILDEMSHTRRVAYTSTFRIERPDGTVSWIQSQGRADRGPNGEIVRLTGLELDVTERRLAEEAFRRRRDQEHDRELRQLLETSAQGVVSVDAHGEIVTANRALESMFGWGPGELLGKSIELLVPTVLRGLHRDHRREYIVAPRPRLMGGGLELVGQRKDASTFPIEVSLNHVGQPGSGRVFAFVTDITERRRSALALAERTNELERRTLQLSRMASDLTLAEQRAREDIAKTLHDGLQQMLVIARLNLEQQVKHDAEHGNAPSDLVRRAADGLAQAIAAARSLSIELFPPVLHHAGLPTALVWLANWARERYGLVVDVTTDPLADSPRKDVRTLLFESVRELLFNAVKHARADRVELTLRSDSHGRLCITVADQGVGFDAATLVEPSGRAPVGWGLFSIRERLALLGGQFTIESRPGSGARFQLIAPPGRADRAPDETSAPGAVGPLVRPDSTATEPTPDALRILVVDDHAAVRHALSETLHQWPELRVVGEASTGFEAIAQADALRPDVVLMDVSMPELDGIQATRHIRAAFPSIEVLGLSMQGRSDDVHPIEDAGAAAFFVKGVDTQRLIDRLRHASAARRDRANGPRVLIADDYEPIAIALKRTLSVECEVVGIVADGHAVARAMTALKPDVVVVDVNLPGISGLDVCRDITRVDPHPKVIVITGLPDPEIKALALAAGASAFVSKTEAAGELLAAVNRAVDDGNR